MIITFKDLPFPSQGSGLPRSSDPSHPHLTDLLRRLGRKLNLVPNYENGNKTLQWDMGLTSDVGFWWEEVFSHVFGQRSMKIARIGEVERDGIVGSPDGIGMDWEEEEVKGAMEGRDGSGMVEPVVLYEYKATWKSCKNPPDANWLWMAQVKSYLWMLGLRVAIMPIAYLVGDWRGSGPVYREARLRFGEDELRKNWEMVVKFKEEEERVE